MQSRHVGSSCRLGWLVACYLIGIAGLYLYLMVGGAFRARVADWAPSLGGLVGALGFLGGETSRTILLAGSYALLWAAYTVGVLRLRRDPPPRRPIFLWALCFAALFIVLPPYFSEDVIGYAQYGKVLAAYGENPYTRTLSELGDPWAVHNQYWRHMPCPYGPVMTVLLAAVVAAARNSLLFSVVLLKLLMGAAYVCSGFLIARILGATDSNHASFGLFFFMWNPLVLLELVGQSHNEAVMIALMLMGIYIMVRGSHAWAFFVILLSGLTKVTTLILLPLYACWLLRMRALRTIAQAAVLSLAALAASYVAFYSDPRALHGVTETTRLTWLSLTWLGSRFLHQYFGWSEGMGRDAIQAVLLVGLVMFVFWRATKVSSERAFLQEAGTVLMFFLLLVPTRMSPWYLTPIIAAVALTDSPLKRSIAFVITGWPLAVYFRPVMYNPPDWANVLRTVLFFTALALVFCWHASLRRLQRQPAKVAAAAVGSLNHEVAEPTGTGMSVTPVRSSADCTAPAPASPLPVSVAMTDLTPESPERVNAHP